MSCFPISRIKGIPASVSIQNIIVPTITKFSEEKNGSPELKIQNFENKENFLTIDLSNIPKFGSVPIPSTPDLRGSPNFLDFNSTISSIDSGKNSQLQNLKIPESKNPPNRSQTEPTKTIIKFSNSIPAKIIDDTKDKSKKNKLNVIYPIFEKCSFLTTDEFWIELFQKASVGKFRRGFSFKENYIIHKGTDKIYLSSDPVLALNEAMYFFRTKGGIQSENDKIMDKKIIEAQNDNTSVTYTWSDFKRVNIREIFIYEYLQKLSKIYNLKSSEYEQLKYIVNYGLILSYFGSHNIKFENNEIINIEGLVFDLDSRIFKITCPPKKTAVSKSNKKTNVVPLFDNKYISFTEKWHQFVQYFEKGNSKNNYNEKFEMTNSMLYSRANKSSADS